MASATWRSRLLKLNLALVAREKAVSRKSRPRRLRPRLAPEQLEDRTVPSGGIQLLEPAVHHAPTSPPQGPAAQGAPSPVNNGDNQGQDNSPSPQGAAAQVPPPPANNGLGQNHTPTSPGPSAPAPGVDHSPTPPPQGSALGSSSPANNGIDQGQEKPVNPQGPAMPGPLAPANDDQEDDNTPPPHGSGAKGPPSLANNANGRGEENLLNSQGPAVQEAQSPANNGQGHGNSMSHHEQAGQESLSSTNNDQGENNPTLPQGLAALEPEGGQLPTPQPHGVAAPKLPSPANNGQGQNNATLELTANGQGNSNGQGVSEEISSETEISQPTPARVNAANRQGSPLTSESNGSGNENSPGSDNGQAAPSAPLVSTSALVSSGIRVMSAELAQESNAAERAVSAEAAQGSSAAETFAQTLLADESIALGVIASEGGPVEAPSASPSRVSPLVPGGDGQVAVPDVGTGSSGGGTPLLIASSPMSSGGGVAAFITKLQESSTKDDLRPLARYIPLTNLDRLFLEWWDDDQLLFPDAMPAVDEMLFPEAMQQIDDMLLPSDVPLSNESPLGEVSSLDLGRLGLVPSAAPTAVRWEDALALEAPATATAEAPRSTPISRPVTVKARRECASAIPVSAEEPAAGDNIRPYQIALGMMPFLVAFGYTPTSLRDHVHVGQRVWKRLRGYLRRSP
jgi:hypothetical protein